MGLLLFLLGILLIALAGPATKLLGVGLAAAGVACLWTGYALMRRGGDR